MADEYPEMRREAIVWTVGTFVVTALITYAAWDSARDNTRLAHDAQSSEQTPALAPAPQ